MAQVNLKVDILMEDYGATIAKTIDMITNDVDAVPASLWGSLLNVDPECKSATTERCRYKPLCIQCRDLSLLSDMTLGKPFIIQCGKMMGTWMLLTTDSLPNLKVEVDMELKDETLRLIGSERKMLECGTPDSTDIVFLKCDPISCNVMVSWLVDSALKDGYWLVSVYKCGNDVYKLQKLRYTLPALRGHLSPCEAKGIVIQVVAMMRKLSEYHFVHGNPSPYSLRMSNDPISTMYDSVHLNGMYRVGLDPGTSSSITSWKTRVCSDNRNWRGTILTPTMENRFVAGKVTLYTIPAANLDTFIDRRSSGIPIYPCSLDLYCILVGLACDPQFESIITGMGWSSLWIKPGDIEKIQLRIAEWKCANGTSLYPEYREIMQMLTGIWLRCDAVDVMWRNIAMST
jgi:hypothetical protein